MLLGWMQWGMLYAERNCWQSLISLESAVLLETKDGPYHPLKEDEIIKG